ncbi:hypothetical protein EGCR1_15085 (plasmid) [Enterococcus gilvus]|jgi:hypothetical protein|nr:hypothetical protein EGCR1_15085 [Enterococcus gilvus]
MPVEKDGYKEKSLEGFDCWIRERRFSCLIPRIIPPIDHPFIPLLNQKERLALLLCLFSSIPIPPMRPRCVFEFFVNEGLK